MIFPFHRIYQWAIAALFSTIALGAVAIAFLLPIGRIPESKATVMRPEWIKVDLAEFSFDGNVFRKSETEPANMSSESLSKRFRLAGTFFAIGANQHARKAILDDLRKKEQLLLSEGDLIENESRIVSILSDRVIVRKGSSDEQILLCFIPGNRITGGQGGMEGLKNQSQSESPNSRFGKMVGDKRWVVQRSELMNYYKEVMNNTDRLAKIYESLKPVYDGRNIAGYHLDVEGEGEMFAAFGLQQGDVIRQVNSLPMTSQLRAEYFIGEFVKNRVNGFVLDIERGGKKDKLIYMVR